MRRQPEREQLNRLTVNTPNQVLFMRPKGAGLLRVLRELQRFSATGRPEALGACYVARWRLP